MSRNSMRNAAVAKPHQGGFTLIEVMMVIVIIAVLTALAYQSYEGSVVSSRRKAATACLLEMGQFTERSYTLNLTYAGVTLPTAAQSQCRSDLAAFYTISFNGTPTATAYALQAVPQGRQATKDTLCGTLGINQRGVKTESGTASAATQCW